MISDLDSFLLNSSAFLTSYILQKLEENNEFKIIEFGYIQNVIRANWCDVLECNVQADDSTLFFGLGGDSLKSYLLLERVLIVLLFKFIILV